MSANDLTLRLSGTHFPDGEIDLDDLGRIAEGLQELATRVGRHVVGQSGPGRTRNAAARAVGLRLTGLSPGSTVLRLAFGEEGVLVTGEAEAEIVERFWEVLVGVEENAPPAWVPPPVADSAVKALDALTQAAARVDVEGAHGRRVAWVRGDVVRDPWLQPRLRLSEDVVTVSGRLEKVDLADRKFRIRDDVGNRIHLDDVVDAEAAAALVGRRTAATGLARYDTRGMLQGLARAALVAHDIPSSWTSRRTSDYEELVRSAPGPDPRGIPDLSDEEIDAFLDALRD
jgi:hypothetical protein